MGNRAAEIKHAFRLDRTSSFVQKNVFYPHKTHNSERTEILSTTCTRLTQTGAGWCLIFSSGLKVVILSR